MCLCTCVRFYHVCVRGFTQNDGQHRQKNADMQVLMSCFAFVQFCRDACVFHAGTCFVTEPLRAIQL